MTEPSPLPEPTPPAIEEPLARELERHQGRWVAVFQNRVVAVGDSAREVRDAAVAQGDTDPIVYRVPAHANRIAFL
jgi:hypothetical protein